MKTNRERVDEFKVRYKELCEEYGLYITCEDVCDLFIIDYNHKQGSLDSSYNYSEEWLKKEWINEKT